MSIHAQQTPLSRRSIPVLAALCLAALAAPFAGSTSIGALLVDSVGSSRPEAVPAAWREVAGQTAVQAAGVGSTWVRFDDGVEIEATGAKSPGRPLGMARSDFDNDGMPDIAVAVADGSSGLVRIYRGNVGSVYPNSREAKSAVADGMPVEAPFQVPALNVNSPVIPEFIVSGDFDGDGNADVAVAADGASSVCILPGNGAGGFGAARMLEVDGAVTALAAGDIDRPDARLQLLVGTSVRRASKILVVPASGAGEPVEIATPGVVSQLLVGDVAGERFSDIIAVTSSGVVIAPGFDSIREAKRPAAEVAASGRNVRSAAVGDFSGGNRLDVALLRDGGVVDVLTGPDTNGAGASAADKPSLVRSFAVAPAGAERVVAAGVSSRPGTDLVVLDRSGRSMTVLEGGDLAKATPAAPVDFEVTGEPVSALPMRLNSDAIDDLVVISSDSASPVVMTSARLRAAFPVTNTNDSGAGSLRDAITMANSMGGADSITFNIAGAGPHTINILSALPPIGEALDIDGTTEPDYSGTPVVVINGSGAGGANGIDAVMTSNVKVSALVVQNFGGAGITLNSASMSIVEGCYVGTSAAGTAAAPNGNNGISVIGSSMATIGGTTLAARNVISGNSGQGIQVNSFSSDTTIIGNFIGVTSGGNTALGNALNGIEIDETFFTMVGNGAAGAANVISAHTGGGGLSNGVYIHGGMSDMNSVLGNIIGLGQDGSTSLGNSANGVLVAALNTTIGTAGIGFDNLISANTLSGVKLDSGSSGSIVSGNVIGLNSSGTSARGNGDGVLFDGASFVIVGGFSPADANTISGNSFAGVKSMNCTVCDVLFNNIGLDLSGMSPVPNLGNGILILVGVDMIIGNNKISQNGVTGIGVNAGSNIVFTANSISGNANLGIDLNSDGVTANDPLDADMGTNTLQNYPVISSAITADQGMGDVTTVSGSLNSQANTDYLIEFFINPSCDGTGFGEGQIYAGSTIVTTDVMGDAPFNTDLSVVALTGQFITATASEFGLGGARNAAVLNGKPFPLYTSEFSACALVTSLDADVSVNIADSPDPIVAGDDITYTLTVNNAGPLTANNAVVSIATPANTTFQSATGDVGWTVSQAPPMGNTGLVSFANPMFLTGGPAVLTVVVRVDNFTPGGTVITGMADISSDQNDPVTSNNDDSTTTTVQAVADISVEKISDVPMAMPGDDITYTVTVFGAVSDDAVNPVLTDVVPTNTTFQSIVAPMGWSVMTPPVNGTGTITATSTQLNLKSIHVFTITVRVNPGVSGGTTITNTATLASSTFDPDNSNNSDFADVGVVAPPAQADLSVTRVASPDPAVRGQNLTYTITVSNNGPDAASSLSLFETLPVDVSLVSVSLPAGWTEGGKGQGRGGGFPLEYVTSSMAPNTAAIFTVVVSVSLLTPDGTFLDGESEIVSFGTPDPNPSNNIASTSTEVGAPPQTDLSLDKTATPSTVTPGAAITYTLVATNIGTQSATDLSITDATPAGTTFVAATPSTGGNLTAPNANSTGSILCVWPGATAPGESRTLTVIVNVSATAEDGSTIVNSASTASLSFDSDFSNNSDSVAVAVSTDENLPRADVEISTSTIPEMIDTGEPLVYTILVTNNGPDTAEDVLLRTSNPFGTRFVSATTSQGTVSSPPPGGSGVVEIAIGDLAANDTVTIALTVNVIGEGGDTLEFDVVIESSTVDPVAGNNAAAGSTEVVAGNDVLLTWDPPIPTDGDERNPPLHLQTQTVTRGSLAAAVADKLANPRNTLVGYNIYRSNMPNTAAVPANFFTSVPANTTTIVAPTAPGGSFFVVTATYPNGESDSTNAASGGVPEPDIASFSIKGNKVIINGEGFTDSVTVFIDGIPFTKAAKVKKENTRVQQKGRLLTGQSVSQYLNQQGGVILVSVLNSDTGIGTFLYRR